MNGLNIYPQNCHQLWFENNLKVKISDQAFKKTKKERSEWDKELGFCFCNQVVICWRASERGPDQFNATLLDKN